MSAPWHDLQECSCDGTWLRRSMSAQMCFGLTQPIQSLKGMEYNFEADGEEDKSGEKVITRR